MARALEGLVRSEAARLISEDSYAPDPELVRKGWERRFIADGQRAREVKETYEELGFQVRLEPVQLREVRPECKDCQLIMLANFSTVYTRKESARPDRDERAEGSRWEES